MSPGVRTMLWSALAFSVMSALVKLAGSRLPSAEIAIWRGVVTLGLSGWALHRARLSPWGKDTRWLLVRGLLGCVGLHCYYFALTALPLAEATVIQFLNPVIVAALAPFVLGERPGSRDVLGTLAGFAGVLLIARPAVIFGDHGEAAPLSPVGVAFALFGRDALAEDAGVPPAGSGFAGFALAHNVASEAAVDATLAEAVAAGGRLVRAGERAPWGGFRGYFADPDGFLWEVCHNPFFPLDAQGFVQLPA